MALDPMMAMMMLGGGMGQMAAGANPYDASGGGGSSLQRQMAPLRAMSYINRDSRAMGPTPRAGRGAGAQFMPGMGGQDGMDYSQFTFDPQAHAAASHFLGQYGLSPLDPSQVRQNTVLPNTSFFNNHPRLSGMLEGGIYGAAASRGSNTWGEGIQSVADSLIAGPRMRAAAYNQQFERPFQAASMLEGIEDRAQKRELTGAEIERTRAQTQALKDKPDAIDRFAHFYEDPQGMVHGITESGKNQKFGEMMDKEKAGSSSHPGVAPVYRYFRSMGVSDPDKATPQQWAKANKLYASDQVAIAGTKSGASADARIRAEYKLGDKVPLDVKSQAQQVAKGWLDPKNKEVRFSVMKQAMDAGKDLPTEEQVDNEINRRNAETNEKIHSVYENFMQTQQNPLP